MAAGELECGDPHEARRLLADPDKEVGVAVEDVDVLGVEMLLLQPVPGDLNLHKDCRERGIPRTLEGTL